MHEHYDENDEEYSDDQYNHDYPPKDPYQWYFKFNIGPETPISDWLSDMLNQWVNPESFKNLSGSWEFFNIPGFESKKFPVSSWTPDTGQGNTFQYLGANYQGSQIWKKKYFVIDKINIAYKLHIQSHALHFVKQPSYYNGLFDILN